MIIPKERLSGEDVRQVVEATVREYLKLAIDGYKCDTATVVSVLVKAAIEGQTIESVCEDLEKVNLSQCRNFSGGSRRWWTSVSRNGKIKFVL